jgi:hypothetical protein
VFSDTLLQGLCSGPMQDIFAMLKLSILAAEEFKFANMFLLFLVILYISLVFHVVRMNCCYNRLVTLVLGASPTCYIGA